MTTSPELKIAEEYKPNYDVLPDVMKRIASGSRVKSQDLEESIRIVEYLYFKDSVQDIALTNDILEKSLFTTKYLLQEGHPIEILANDEHTLDNNDSYQLLLEENETYGYSDAEFMYRKRLIMWMEVFEDIHQDNN